MSPMRQTGTRNSLWLRAINNKWDMLVGVGVPLYIYARQEAVVPRVCRNVQTSNIIHILNLC
jgi:hypothetical protein